MNGNAGAVTEKSGRRPIANKKGANDMDTRLTGIIRDGDIGEFKGWVEKQFGSASERKSEITDMKTEIALLRQTIERMDEKIDKIERILEKVSE